MVGPQLITFILIICSYVKIAHLFDVWGYNFKCEPKKRKVGNCKYCYLFI